MRVRLGFFAVPVFYKDATGQAKTVKVALTAPKKWGAFTLRAFADVKNATAEDDENKNQLTYAYATGLPASVPAGRQNVLPPAFRRYSSKIPRGLVSS